MTLKTQNPTYSQILLGITKPCSFVDKVCILVSVIGQICYVCLLSGVVKNYNCSL